MKRLIFTLVVCMMLSSVCFGQETNTSDVSVNSAVKYSQRFDPGIYVIGKDINRDRYMLIANDPDEIACVAIYDGKNSVGKPFGRKYYLKDREFYDYPNIFEGEDQFGTRDVSYPENLYTPLYFDYFEYDTILDLSGFINNKTLENCYIELVNCYAVLENEAPPLDPSRNGMFRVGTDLPPGEYTVSSVITDEGNEEYAIMGDYFSIIKPAGLNFNDSRQPYYSSDIADRYSVKLSYGDYIVKKDVTLENSAVSYKLTPRKKTALTTDKKYDFSQVGEGFRKNVMDTVYSKLMGKAYFKTVNEENRITDAWLSSAKNDSERKFAYMVKEMYRLYNYDMLNVSEIKNRSAIAERKDEIYDEYRQLFNRIKAAESFADIEYVCGKVVLNRY